MRSGNDQGRGPAEFTKAKNDITDRVKKESQSAGEALQTARDEIGRKAADYTAEVQEAVSEKAQQTQRDIGS
ncbi:hypothetical protein EN823_16195, partial [bacterium M00.F.Ca.ET.180.01.1.1]